MLKKKLMKIAQEANNINRKTKLYSDFTNSTNKANLLPSKSLQATSFFFSKQTLTLDK